MDKEQVYYILTNCGIPDRIIKFHIEDIYNPPRIGYNKVTSDVYHIQDELFDAKTGEEDTDDEYLKDLRFEYDLKD